MRNACESAEDFVEKKKKSHDPAGEVKIGDDSIRDEYT